MEEAVVMVQIPKTLAVEDVVTVVEGAVMVVVGAVTVVEEHRLGG